MVNSFFSEQHHGNQTTLTTIYTRIGLMQRRFASINNLPIKIEERLFHWESGHWPDDHPGLSDLGL